MDRRDILRKEVIDLENKTGIKRVIKKLNSVSDCRIAIKQIHEEFFRRKEINEKEKLYKKIVELSEKIKNLELEIKQEKNINLKDKKSSDKIITDLKEENNKFKESTIKLQRDIIEAKERIEILRKENLELIDLNDNLEFEIKEIAIKKDIVLKENDDLRHKIFQKKPSLFERIFKK